MADESFADALRRWMATLQVTDTEVARAFVGDNSYGLFLSAIKRVGEWRRGEATPQGIGRANQLEAALKGIAHTKGVLQPEGSLVGTWQSEREQRRLGSKAISSLHQSVRSALNGREGDKVRIVGFVDAYRSRGGIVFLDVSDGMSVSPLQFGVIRNTVTAACWDSVSKLKKGARIRATGNLRPNNQSRLVAWLDAPPVVQDAITDKSLATAAPEQRQVAAALLTAAVQSVAEDHLRQSGYLGIATRVLSSLPYDRNSFMNLRQLGATYPGFGSSVTIASSPSQQLVDAILLSGSDRVFASSHCFTTSYRDELDGVETDLVMAKAIDLDRPELLQTIEDLLESIGRSIDSEILMGGRLRLSEQTWPELRTTMKEFPQVVIANINTKNISGDVTVFRVYAGPSCAPIEASIQPFASGLEIATIAIFPARFLPLLERIPIRRIYPLGGAPDSN